MLVLVFVLVFVFVFVFVFVNVFVLVLVLVFVFVFVFVSVIVNTPSTEQHLHVICRQYLLYDHISGLPTRSLYLTIRPASFTRAVAWAPSTEGCLGPSPSYNCLGAVHTDAHNCCSRTMHSERRIRDWVAGASEFSATGCSIGV